VRNFLFRMFPEKPLKIDSFEARKKNYWLLIWLEN